MSTPESEVVTPAASKEVSVRKSTLIVLGVVLIMDFIAVVAGAVSRHEKSAACESFWKESCTDVYVPASIESNFSKSYYESVK
jgi:hypothetical protein